ncbi:MAG: phage tail protein [Flavobacterium sp.]
MDEFIGTIQMFAGNFAPQGWMFCHGQTVLISQYTALFSIIGRTYGGDGVNNFALPDLRGRVPVGAGEPKSEKLLTFYEGKTVGEKEVVLNPSNMPKLQATAVIKDLKAVAKGVIEDTIKPVINIPCSDNSADSNNPKGKYIGLSDAVNNNSSEANIYGNTANTFMKPFENSSRVSIKAELPVVTDGTPTVDINIGTPTPNGIPTYQPSLGINFIICVVGVYPPRP